MICSCCHFISKRLSKAIKFLGQSKSLARDLKGQCIRMNIKQTVRIKIQLIGLDIFWNQTL